MVRYAIVLCAGLLAMLTGCGSNSPPGKYSPRVVIEVGYDIDLSLQIAGNASSWTGPLFTLEDLEKRADLCKQVWAGWEPLVMPMMEQELGLRFKSAKIPAFIVGNGGQPFSRPILIPAELADTSSGCVAAVAHELVHNLTKGAEGQILKRATTSALGKESEDGRFANHVVVFSALVASFGKLGGNNIVAIERSRAGTDKKDPYVRAWARVDHEGAEAILAKFRKGVNRTEGAK
ncbi:MAG: hypothetical protein AAB561_00150 [Patescibacteria group bacterium]